MTQKEKEAVLFEQNLCKANVGRLQALLHLCHEPCKHVAKRLNDEVTRLEVGYAAAANKAEKE